VGLFFHVYVEEGGLSSEVPRIKQTIPTFLEVEALPCSYPIVFFSSCPVQAIFFGCIVVLRINDGRLSAYSVCVAVRVAVCVAVCVALRMNDVRLSTYSLTKRVRLGVAVCVAVCAAGCVAVRDSILPFSGNNLEAPFIVRACVRCSVCCNVCCCVLQRVAAAMLWRLLKSSGLLCVAVCAAVCCRGN